MEINKKSVEGICLYERDFKFLEMILSQVPFRYDKEEQVVETSNGLVLFDCGRWAGNDEWKANLKGRLLEKMLNLFFLEFLCLKEENNKFKQKNEKRLINA